MVEVSDKRILYNEEGIIVREAEMPDEHEVFIENNIIYLDRGIMSEWATSPISRISVGYRALSGADYEQENPGVPITDFGRALSIARIKELEDQVQDAYHQISELHEKQR